MRHRDFTITDFLILSFFLGVLTGIRSGHEVALSNQMAFFVSMYIACIATVLMNATAIFNNITPIGLTYYAGAYAGIAFKYAEEAINETIYSSCGVRPGYFN